MVVADLAKEGLVPGSGVRVFLRGWLVSGVVVVGGWFPGPLALEAVLMVAALLRRRNEVRLWWVPVAFHEGVALTFGL
jgi:hypothetical protein